MTTTCRIQWVDPKTGQPTPDNSTAIGETWREAYVDHSTGTPYPFPQTERFPICEWHARRLSEPGMTHWKLERYPEPEQ